MKKFLMGAAAVLLALGGLLTGCTNGDDDDDGTSDVGRPDIVMGLSVLLNGENLSTENAVNLSNGSSLSSTGITVTADVTKDKNVAPESKDVSSAAKFTIDGVSYTWDEPLKVGTGNKELTANEDYTVEVSYKEKSARFTLRLTNWSVEGVDTITLVAGDTLAADWATGIKVKNGAEDVTTSATIALYGDDTEIKVGKTITGEKFEIRVTYNGVTVTLGVKVTGSGSTGSGSETEPFILTNETLSETIGEQTGAFDVHKHQSSTTWDVNAALSWDNPLYGKTGLDGVTISFMLNNKVGVSFDSVLTFFPGAGSTDGWGGVAFTENGTAHAQGHGFWDIYLTSDGTGNGTNKIPAATWTRVTYVITKTSVTAYIGSEKFKEIPLADVDTINYLTTVCDKVAVGVGFCPELWLAGFVDEGTYLADIQVYAVALTAEQVAAISGKVLQSISVDAGETPPIFTVGSIFTTGTLTVTAHYKDGSDERVNVSDCTFKIGDNLLEPGKTKLTDDVLGEANANDTYTVTVSYTEGNTTKTAPYNITVTKDVVLSRIELDTSEAKVAFTVGDTFTADGLIVTAHYSDGSSDEVTDYTLNIGNTKLTSGTTILDESVLGKANDDGTYTVTVTYKNSSKTYTISVTKAVQSITIKTEPTVKNGITHSAPNLSGLVITVSYGANDTEEVQYDEHPGDFKTNPAKFTEAGDIDVKIVYNGHISTNSYKVTVKTVAAAAAYYALDGNDNGVKIEGNGSYVEDNTFGTGKVFKNDGTAQRTNYLLLPADTLQHSATSKQMTIGFWVNANNTTLEWHPLLTAYHQKNTPNNLFDNGGYPMFYIESRCLMAVNCAGWTDFTESQNTFKSKDWNENWNFGYNAWKDSDWHYFAAVITETSATIYIDGEKIVSWTISGEGDGNVVAGLFANADETSLSYVCLGGNQALDWGDNDAPYSFAKFSVWNVALNEEQIQSVVDAK